MQHGTDRVVMGGTGCHKRKKNKQDMQGMQDMHDIQGKKI